MSTDAAAVAPRCPDCSALLGIGDFPFGCTVLGVVTAMHRPRGGTGNAAIHTSERAVIFRNPRTGEVRYPPRADAPLHPKYAMQGYVREEIRTHSERKALERETGRIQEAAYFDNGSSGAERSLLTNIPDRPPQLTQLDDPSA